MKHRLSVLLIPMEEGGLMARCERVRATATGGTREEAIANLQDAIVELVREYGEEAVFQDLPPGTISLSATRIQLPRLLAGFKAKDAERIMG